MMDPGGLSPDIPAAALLGRIQDLFRELAIFEQPLTLTYQGQEYLISCDAHAFTIYRLSPNCHFSPGKPGWAVCLVTPEMAVDESSPPCLEEDEFATGLTLQDWLALIKKTFGK
jgi:hypothetical protein